MNKRSEMVKDHIYLHAMERLKYEKYFNLPSMQLLRKQFVFISV